MPRRRSILRLLAAGPLLAAALPLTGLAQPGRPAPDFAGIDAWLNTPEPLTLAGLRGQVVLVDFWTYSCINCRRTVPYLNRWQAEYGGRGSRSSAFTRLSSASSTCAAMSPTLFRSSASASP